MRQVVDWEYGGQVLHLYPPFPKNYLGTLRREGMPEIKIIYGHLMYGIHDRLGIPANYVTVLRHPVTRIISFYQHNAKHAHASHYESIHRGLSLKQFLEAELTHETNNQMTRMIAGCVSQNTNIDDQTVLDAAIEYLRRDFLCVGIMENMPETMRNLSEKLNWRGNYKAPYLNMTRKHGIFALVEKILPGKFNTVPSQQVDGATLEALKKYNRLDLELYDYVVKNCL